jgi:hypothetical protein
MPDDRDDRDDGGGGGNEGNGDRGRDGGGGRRPDNDADLAELIRFLAVNLVEKPDEVRVELVEERNANVYELYVA